MEVPCVYTNVYVTRKTEASTDFDTTEASSVVIYTSLWMDLIFYYGEVIKRTHLIQVGIRDVFACEYNPNTTNITIGWKRCILRKLTKTVWSGTELIEEMENDEDNGPIVE